MQDIIEIPSFYHQQWAPNYPEFAHFKYARGIYQIRVRQHRGKFFFADGLKDFKRELNNYESTTINFYAYGHN